MSLSIATYPISKGLQGVAAGANPSNVSGRGQGTPWISRQLIAGPSLVSNVGFSISLKDTSTCPEPGFEPATFISLVNLLHPLSYSYYCFLFMVIYVNIICNPAV